MCQSKADWLNYFRNKATVELNSVSKLGMSYKDTAGELNKRIKTIKDNIINSELKKADACGASNEEKLNRILLITYVSNIVMLEYRNKVWKYEYMAFARRIGELWEPFCKLAFEYPIKNLEIIVPPDFNDVQNKLKHDAISYIDHLDLLPEIKTELKSYYNIPWDLVDSGGIKLSLDLHFRQDGINYNCDFKSGFSSNEKGNTNRLLLVASIFKSLSKDEKLLLFVRQSEDENNHYLQTLKNSPYWEVYCADSTYAIMSDFTGFDLRRWLNENATWVDDIDDEFRRHLVENDLIKYLTW